MSATSLSTSSITYLGLRSVRGRCARNLCTAFSISRFMFTGRYVAHDVLLHTAEADWGHWILEDLVPEDVPPGIYPVELVVEQLLQVLVCSKLLLDVGVDESLPVRQDGHLVDPLHVEIVHVVDDPALLDPPPAWSGPCRRTRRRTEGSVGCWSGPCRRSRFSHPP